jgi:hypothetical protein
MKAFIVDKYGKDSRLRAGHGRVGAAGRCGRGGLGERAVRTAAAAAVWVPTAGHRTRGTGALPSDLGRTVIPNRHNAPHHTGEHRCGSRPHPRTKDLG